MNFQHFPSKTFINGAWVDSTSGQQLEVIDPATGKLLGSVPDCTADDLNLAVQSAYSAFQICRALTAEVLYLTTFKFFYLSCFFFTFF
jgi:succinate-semialdehyde dehydrogenase/glutarate-semialdehyde dehydrogenase